MYSDVCCQKDGVYDEIEQKQTDVQPDLHKRSNCHKLGNILWQLDLSFVLIISSSLLNINVLDHNDKLHCH